MKYAIFVSTILRDFWLKDSISSNLEEISEYIKKNLSSLNSVAGKAGDWTVCHYDTDKILSEVQLTTEENSKLNSLLKGK